MNQPLITPSAIARRAIVACRHRFVYRAPRACYLAGVLVSIVACAAYVFAADTVVLKESPGKDTTRVKGEIVDYLANELTLKIPSGREQRYSTDDILSVEYERDQAHLEAEKLLGEGKFAEAGEKLKQALQNEKRRWVQREIQSLRVVAELEAERPIVAVELFLALTRDDPNTRHFDVIPLAWLPEQPSPALEEKAQRWLTHRDSPLARILGASWLLATARRNAVAAELEQLAANADRRVAQLAVAQQWRARLSTISGVEVTRWQSMVEKMPETLRAGPYFLLGKGLARLGRHEEAALALMRVPILFPQPRKLAAEALLAAGQELDALGRSDEAQAAYRELAMRYEGSSLVEAVRQRLEAKKSRQP